eukprot:SAG31_NODE_57_length_29727_cov_12.584568_20_plen_170_part_00
MSQELARHEGGALRTSSYFLTRQQRRELELQVELGFKREKPHVRMPQLSLKYTDKSLLDMANTMEGILYNGPRKPPAGLGGEPPGQAVAGLSTQQARNGVDAAAAAAAALRNSGPVSQASFELFLEPIVHEYFQALPATGAVVTLVKGDNIFYSQGFGITGRTDKVKLK